ncbi:MAG: DCC1-like thiol-disulfide oxidoreductase family protein [Ginsengibacter sp.]
MSAGPIILFDGVCNFCNAAANFVIKRDKRGQLKFAFLQSEFAEKLLMDKQLPTFDSNTFLFIENEKIYSRSTAALKVCRYLNGLWPLLYGLMIVPAFIRDGIYNWVAKNRYQWFGKKNMCTLPPIEVRSRFLNEMI